MRRGDYELIELIGRGGMAEVWRARHDGPGGATKGVALKLIHNHLAADPLYRELFIREAKLAMQLNSPNIVQVFGVGEERGELFLVMEWVQGHNLSRILRMTRPPGSRNTPRMPSILRMPTSRTRRQTNHRSVPHRSARSGSRGSSWPREVPRRRSQAAWISGEERRPRATALA